MVAILEKTKQIDAKASVIYLIDDSGALSKHGFTKEEISYMQKQYKTHETKVFAFNRLGRWDFVQYVNVKESGPENREKIRKAGDGILSRINGNKLEKVIVADMLNNASCIKDYAEGMALGNYQFSKYKKGKESIKALNTLKKISLFSPKMVSGEVDEMNIVIAAVYKSRDLVNEPVAYMNAQKLAEEARLLCQPLGAKVEILNKSRIEALKMGGLIGVNRGSVDPPTFTIIEWKPAKAVNKKPYVLVGKGLVFDTGGINLKPGNHMEDMKCDMGGGSAVIGAMYAIAKAKLKVHVIGLVPATDNRPSGNCQVPGDVITMFDGTTVEVLNTDAEGRLILGDALGYAKKLKPELVIDLATLTGSAHAAVGRFAMVGMGAKHDKHMPLLMKCSQEVCERIVEFPLWDDYSELIKSEVADIRNIGGMYAGAIAAGKFLEHFTDYPWIHLDIAGPAFMNSRDSYRGSGGTGWGVRLLFDFMKNKCR